MHQPDRVHQPDGRHPHRAGARHRRRRQRRPEPGHLHVDRRRHRSTATPPTSPSTAVADVYVDQGVPFENLVAAPELAVRSGDLATNARTLVRFPLPDDAPGVHARVGHPAPLRRVRRARAARSRPCPVAAPGPRTPSPGTTSRHDRAPAADHVLGRRLPRVGRHRAGARRCSTAPCRTTAGSIRDAVEDDVEGRRAGLPQPRDSAGPTRGHAAAARAALHTPRARPPPPPPAPGGPGRRRVRPGDHREHRAPERPGRLPRRGPRHRRPQHRGRPQRPHHLQRPRASTPARRTACWPASATAATTTSSSATARSATSATASACWPARASTSSRT